MKNILCCSALTLLLLTPFTIAGEERTPVSQINVSDPERMLIEIDLRVLLQSYEKLKTELRETELQMALIKVGAFDLATVDAKKALADKENDKTITQADLEVAKKKYEESMSREQDRIRSKIQVLELLAADTRHEATRVAKELAERTQHESKPADVQPRS